MQLQRQAIEIAAIHETSRLVSQHNAHLEREVETLRIKSERHPSVDISSAQAAELTLQRVQEQLAATESQLLSQNRTIADLRASNSRLEHNESASRQLVEEARRREAAASSSEREVQLALRQAIEERNMSDYVVYEYADLVKSLEAKSNAKARASLSATSTLDASGLPSNPQASTNSTDPSTSRSTPLDSMVEGRNGLQKLVQEMSTETTRLHHELHTLHAQLESTKVELESCAAVGKEDRVKLASAQAELLKLQADDNAAAKLVSRYMWVTSLHRIRRRFI